MLIQFLEWSLQMTFSCNEYSLCRPLFSSISTKRLVGSVFETDRLFGKFEARVLNSKGKCFSFPENDQMTCTSILLTEIIKLPGNNLFHDLYDKTIPITYHRYQIRRIKISQTISHYLNFDVLLTSDRKSK